jgi:hypothetical protein
MITCHTALRLKEEIKFSFVITLSLKCIYVYASLPLPGLEAT